MVILKSEEEIEKLAVAGAIVGRVHEALNELIKPGVLTKSLDEFAEAFIRNEGALPAFKGYRGFKATLCVSINNEVVHGIPGMRRLEEGDIVSIDCGAVLDGYYGDAARTYPVGKIVPKIARLIETTRLSLERGIEQMQVGNRLHDISWAIQDYVESHGFSVVKDFVGHGIGKHLHEEPAVPNYGKKGTGMKLEPGLVLALEPMVNRGTDEVRLLDDGWTAVTSDGEWSAHWEDTIAVTEAGPRILTRV